MAAQGWLTQYVHAMHAVGLLRICRASTLACAHKHTSQEPNDGQGYSVHGARMMGLKRGGG